MGGLQTMNNQNKKKLNMSIFKPRTSFYRKSVMIKFKRGFLDCLTQPSGVKNPISFIQIERTFKYYIINEFNSMKELFSKEAFTHRSAADF